MHGTSFRLALGLVFASVSGGCAAPAPSDVVVTSAASTRQDAPPNGETAGPTSGASSTAPCASGTRGCTSSGEFALSATGTGFVDLAGKEVHVSAIEPSDDVGTVIAPAVVLASTVRSDGSFELSCEKAIRPNGVYPSAALWVDVNGDGKCGDGDFAQVDQWYAWGGDVAIASTPTTVELLPDADVYGWGKPFCEYYGFPR